MAPNQPPTKKPKYVEDIQRLLECPVCLLNPKYPDKVHFCSNGHMICHGCHAQIQSCPVCRSADLNGQNPLLKQVLSKLPRLCAFSEQGCGVESGGSEMEKHVKICNFRLIACINSGCGLQGFNSYITHLIENHDATFLEDYERDNLEHTIIIPNKKSFRSPSEIFNFNDHTFIIFVSVRRSIFRFQFFILGTKSDAEKYTYDVKLKNDKGTRYDLKFSAEVTPIDLPYQTRVDHPGTFLFAYPTAQEFSVRDIQNREKLTLQVTVKKKSFLDHAVL